MRVRCHKAIVQPMGWELRIYGGEEGWKHLHDDLKRHGGRVDMMPDCAAIFVGYDTTLYIHVGDLDEDGMPDSLLAVVHEALHATTYVWETVGANLHVHHNDEVLAYTQGHILDLVMSAFMQGE